MNQLAPNLWSLSGFQRYKVEVLLTFAMGTLGAIYAGFPDLRVSLQSVSFVPVVISSMLLGWKKSSAFTVVGVCLLICVFCFAWTDHSPAEFLNLVLWGCTLGTTGAVIGLIASTREKQVHRLLAKQNSLALTDPLTQIANRRAFDIEIGKRMSETLRHDRTLSVLMIDIDYFKNFNDQYGHNVGDTVLQTIAGSIQKCLRDADLVARFGGEEFSVLLPDTCLAEALIVAERIRSTVDQISDQVISCPQKVSVSIGVTEIDSTDDESSILERADIAMYAAKRGGRNQVFSSRLSKQDAVHGNAAETLTLTHSIFDEAQSMPHDVEPVTGLTYRKVFDKELSRRIYESARYGMDLCLGLVKVGHSECPSFSKEEVGQQISNVGEKLRKSLRESDVITWFSELEFGLLLPFTSLEDAEHVCRRLFFEINTDVMLAEENTLFYVQSMKVIQLKAGDSKKQVLKNPRAAVPIDSSGIISTRL
ncbi:MAG: diguanylate cyclase [Planctomycetota bacterium]|nr:diguanylate cyclase [Planctomycetota bacterium]